MTLTTATPFAEAIAEIARRGILPTALRGAALAAVANGFARDAIFSAGLIERDVLAEYKSLIEQLVSPYVSGAVGGTDRASARLSIREKLKTAGITGDANSNDVTDATSDRRINLMLDHWTTMARAKGQTVRNNDDALLWSHPCYELVRFEARDQKRTWIEIWRGAGGEVFAGTPEGPSLNPELTEGRLIARKDDPIWFRISRFNRAEPPYDFNSGVGRAPVPRAECIELGVISADEKSGPTPLESPFPDQEVSS